MTPPIGFVIVAFNLPEQTINLCARLSEMFGDPPIALHHDFGQCDLDTSKLPGQVRVVRPHFATKWGAYAVAEANLAALRLLYEDGGPDWCVSLSTADYPIKSAERILEDLQAAQFDGFIDHREIQMPKLNADHVRDQSLGFSDPEWLKVAYQRYVAIELNSLPVVWRLPVPQRYRVFGGRLVETLFTPFRGSYRPYGGDHWYTLNRKAALRLGTEDKKLEELRRHFANRRSPEESLYATILCNDPNLKISAESLRYSDWSRGGSGPRLLGMEDIPAMMRSRAHFARKFAFDPELFGRVDTAAEPAG